MILNKNGFRKFSNGVELNDFDKSKFDTTNGKIKLGSIASPNGKIQLTMFIDKEGKIKTSDNPTEYDVVGLEFVTFDTGNTGDSSKEPDIKNIDIIEQHKSSMHTATVRRRSSPSRPTCRCPFQGLNSCSSAYTRRLSIRPTASSAVEI